MFLLVPADPGCPGQNPESRKTVVCVCVRVCTLCLVACPFLEYRPLSQLLLARRSLYQYNGA